MPVEEAKRKKKTAWLWPEKHHGGGGGGVIKEAEDVAAEHLSIKGTISQESVRKDVERAFGVLQARFVIVKNPALFWNKVKIGKIMRACIILHNMIVEDERDGYTHFNLSEFDQEEGNGIAHVDYTYSTDMPTNLANVMANRNQIRDKIKHEQLKADLVEHIWQKFGSN